MRLGVIVRTLGVLFLLFSATLLPPIAISFFYGDGELERFSIAFGISLLSASPSGCRSTSAPPTSAVATVRDRRLMWSAMSVLGAVRSCSRSTRASPTHSSSPRRATRPQAHVFVGLDQMSESILFYRQEIQWLGGIGVIVLAIALLPMLGIGGMQLYKAETRARSRTSGSRANHRTARNVCGVYILLTAICALCYWLAGMSVFDAVGHSFSTLSTGGYSPHDASIAYFNSPLIEAVAIVFMLIGGSASTRTSSRGVRCSYSATARTRRRACSRSS